MAIPSRTLKVATDFLALVTTGFCPAIAARSGAGTINLLTVCNSLTHTHIENNFLNSWDLHRVLVAKLLTQDVRKPWLRKATSSVACSRPAEALALQ